jgi:HlyD family secretion protein
MSVDIRQLAVERERSRTDPHGSSIGPPRRVVSRVVLPLVLLTGFLLVSAWAARDSLWPRHEVTVIPVHVSTVEVLRSGTPLFKAAGWIEPRPTPIRVAALAEGVIEKLLVVEDQAVEAGEPIAYLVADDARLALEAAQATLKLREAEVERSRAALQAAQTNFAEPTYLQAEIAAAEADLKTVETQLSALPFEIDSAKAVAKFSQADLAAKLTLAEAEAAFDTSTARVEELMTRLPSLEAERESLASKLAAVQRKLELKTEERRTLDEARAQLDAAVAVREQASVAVAEARLRFDRMTIRAPVAGRVMHLLTTPGTFVSGNVSMGSDKVQHDSGSVVTLYQPDRLQVRVDVRFEDLPQTVLGQPVQIESPAISEPIVGWVLFPTSFADIQKNTLSVKVGINDPPDVLKPEMLVDVTFLSSGSSARSSSGQEGEKGGRSGSDDKPDAPLRILIPRELVSSDESGAAVVWLADLSAGVARRQRVEVGDSGSGPLVEVTSGLTPASRLIASGQADLHDGDRIRVTSTSATPSAARSNDRHLERRPGSGT